MGEYIDNILHKIVILNKENEIIGYVIDYNLSNNDISNIIEYYINNYQKDITVKLNFDKFSGNNLLPYGFKFIEHTSPNYWYVVNRGFKDKDELNGAPYIEYNKMKKQHLYFKIYGSGNIILKNY